MTPTRPARDEILRARLELAGVPDVDRELEQATYARMVAEGTPLAERAAAWMARTGRTVREVVASLAHDATALPAEALRGSATATPRMLVYETESIAISLRLQHEGDRVSLRGQLIPRDDRAALEGAQVEVTCEAELTSAAVTEFGEFELDDLPRGPLDLVVGVDDQVIRLSPLPGA